MFGYHRPWAKGPEKYNMLVYLSFDILKLKNYKLEKYSKLFSVSDQAGDEHNSSNSTFYPELLFVKNVKWAIEICTILATQIFLLIAGEILLPRTSTASTLPWPDLRDKFRLNT